ncbi:MAG: hypothetical protein ACFB21_15945 [Opitutales bacterium]
MPLKYISKGSEAPDFQRIAQEVLGPVDWQDAHHGFCRCPGADRHQKPTRERDCKVFLDAEQGHAPTVFCFHESCRAEIEAANHRLRSTIGKASYRQHGGALPPLSSSKPKLPAGDPFEVFLRACFGADDIVSIAPGTIPEGETRAVPEHGGVNILTRDQWIERAKAKGGVARLFSGRDGLFVRINPLTPQAKGSDKDVATYRLTLIESDLGKGAVSTPEELGCVLLDVCEALIQAMRNRKIMVFSD